MDLFISNCASRKRTEGKHILVTDSMRQRTRVNWACICGSGGISVSSSNSFLQR